MSSHSSHSTVKIGYFDSQHLPEPQNMYVTWVDLMGTKSRMSISSSQAANFTFKMLSLLKYFDNNSSITVFPFGDGFYLLSSDKKAFTEAINKFYKEAYEVLFKGVKEYHKCMIRGSIAYGPVFIGKNINEEYYMKDNVIIGQPIVQAFSSENQAPPFGSFVHESARAFGKMNFVLYKWFSDSSQDDIAAIASDFKKYFDWCSDNSMFILYPQDAIARHSKQCQEYFKADKSAMSDEKNADF